MKNRYPVILALIYSLFASKLFAANFNITTTQNVPLTLQNNDRINNVNIRGNGSLELSSAESAISVGRNSTFIKISASSAIKNSIGNAIEVNNNPFNTFISNNGVVSGQGSSTISSVDSFVEYIVLGSSSLLSNDRIGGNVITHHNNILAKPSELVELFITNGGIIRATDDASSTAISFFDVNERSSLEIRNRKTGLIDAGTNGKAIVIRGPGSVFIDNLGMIRGSVDLGSSVEAEVVIRGSDNLGLNGDVTFGGNQFLSLLDDGGKGASALSALIGNGSVIIDELSVLTLRAAPDNSPVTANINGILLVPRDFDASANLLITNSSGTLAIASGQTVNFASSVASNRKLDNFNILSGSTASFADNTSISASQINLSGNFNLQGNNIINGNIAGSGIGSISLNGSNHIANGNINLIAGDTINTNIVNKTQAGNLTVNGLVNIADGVKLNASLPSNLINVGDKYTIISGQSGSNINPIAVNNINVGGTGSNKIGILEFTTTNDNDNLILNVSRLSAPEIAAISQESSQPNFVANIFNNINNSLNISSARLSGLKGLASGDLLQNHSVWGQTFASNVNQGNTRSSDGYKANAAGLIFGADLQFENDITAGLSFSYSNSDIKSRGGLSTIDIDSYQMNLYGSYDFNEYFVNGLAGISLNKYSSTRILSDRNAVANANYSGNSYIARVEVGSSYKLANDFILTPILSLSAAKNEVNDYAENGAGLSNLNVKNDSVNFFETRFGGELGKEFIVSKENKIRPKFSMSYGYDFAGDQQTATLNFVGQSASFQSNGSNVARESLKLGTGAEIYHLNSLKINLDYGFETKKNYQAHNGSLKIKYSF